MQVTPSGQYMVAEDGQVLHVQVPAIGQYILALLQSRDPDAVHFSVNHTASMAKTVLPRN